MPPNKIRDEDLSHILAMLSPQEKSKLENATILITGCGGFLGYYFAHFFVRYADELKIAQIIALDNFLTGSKNWLFALANAHPKMTAREFNVITDNIAAVPSAQNADLIIHGASVASPAFYRKYPLETADANIWGLRNMLDFYAAKKIKGFLFFSSSEIYGDPLPEHIPTAEEYRGNVATMGPRACYDEAKRFGETLCYIFGHTRNMPVSIVRPFNNYGPGMSISDKRLPADCAQAIVKNRNLQMFSDGSPTRTFCYVADAIAGYLKALLYSKTEVFNIGINKPELTTREFAALFVEHGKALFGYTGKIEFAKSDDAEYLADNPNRRCPNINKAQKFLNYRPTICAQEGVGRFLRFLKISGGQL